MKMEQLLSLPPSPHPYLARNGGQQFSFLACALCKASALRWVVQRNPFFPVKVPMQTDYEVLREKQGWGPQTLHPVSSFPGLAHEALPRSPRGPWPPSRSTAGRWVPSLARWSWLRPTETNQWKVPFCS